jgi:hypothetical protein
MALTENEIKRLGGSAGEVTASGAFQRLDQAVANFMTRNNATQEEADIFRAEAIDAFQCAVDDHLTDDQ